MTAPLLNESAIRGAIALPPGCRQESLIGTTSRCRKCNVIRVEF